MLRQVARAVRLGGLALPSPRRGVATQRRFPSYSRRRKNPEPAANNLEQPPLGSLTRKNTCGEL
eukprot:5556122-Pyramimonas_sp.AAC.1